jgi:hypothetical protein
VVRFLPLRRATAQEEASVGTFAGSARIAIGWEILSYLSELRTFGGFVGGLPAFLRRRITPGEAHAAIGDRLAHREANFLETMQVGVWANARSPYRALLRAAGCERGDVEGLVRSDGVDGALWKLRAAGVHVTFEEFKGRRPIERNGVSIEPGPSDYDNPSFRRYFRVATGGSTGVPRRVLMDLDYFVMRLPLQVLMDEVHGFLGMRHVQWAEIPPGHGLEAMLLRVPFDHAPERWFTPVWSGPDGPGWRFRMATRAIVATARAVGARVPWPEYLPFDRAEVIARWAEQAVRLDGACGVRAHVSKALRIAVAAEECGIDLSGVTITSGGEPPTRAKVKRITATGARFIANYFLTEAGPMGFGCPASEDPNDQHLLIDHLAMIPWRRSVPGFDVEVESFHYTTLLPTSPKLMLNVETDDYGIVETRACGCLLGSLGFTTHMREIRSFSKLTGEGVTLIGSVMERILEEELPARFGGSALDYQLVEEEDERGFTRLTLLVHPRLVVPDDGAVVNVVHEALARAGGMADVSRGVWAQAGTLRVRREPPHLTARGKLLPLHARRRDPGAAAMQSRGTG